MVSISNELYTDRKERVCRTEGGEHKPSVIYDIRAKPTGLSASFSKRRTPPRRLQMKPDLPVDIQPRIIVGPGNFISRIPPVDLRMLDCDCVCCCCSGTEHWIDSS